MAIGMIGYRIDNAEHKVAKRSRRAVTVLPSIWDYREWRKAENLQSIGHLVMRGSHFKCNNQ